MTDLLTRAWADALFQSITQLTFGVAEDMMNAKGEFVSVKAAIASGRKTTNQKTPTDFLHFQF